MASAETGESIVKVDNLTFAFIPGTPDTLKGLTLALPAGARCVLIGQNGAGKSTLLEILSGGKMVPAKQVSVCGEDPFRGASGKKVALVQGGWRGFGDMERASCMRVWKLLSLADPSEADAKAPSVSVYAESLLEALCLRPLLTRFFGSLSDGERRRVELGLKLQERKELVLLDEATTDLDLLARKKLMHFLEAQGSTVINATHVFDGLEPWVTHLAHLHDGRVLRFEEVPAQGAPQWKECGGLVALATRWLGEVAGETPPVPPSSAPSAPMAEDGGVAVTLKSLNFRYALCCPCALRLDSLQLPQGCCCLLVGLNGSGKSTLLSVLAGRRMIADTDIQVLGFRAFYDHTDLDPLVTILSSEWKRQVAEISSGKQVTFAELANSSIQELVAKGLDMSILASRMVRLVQMLGIDPTKPVGALSDGLLRRVQIALKLLRPCKVLLVDEVTADLDVLARMALLNFLKEEAGAGCSIIYCTHILDGLDGWASHMLRLRPGGHDGELLSIGDVESSMDTGETSSRASEGVLVDRIFAMLTEDSMLEPIEPGPIVTPAPDSSASVELPSGWAKRDATSSGAYGSYAWNADRGTEDTWSFKSTAPKPADPFVSMSNASGFHAMGQQQFPGANIGAAPSTQPVGGYMPQPTLSAAMHSSVPQAAPASSMPDPHSTPVTVASVSAPGLPSGWGARANQLPLDELLARGIAQPENKPSQFS